MYSTLGRHIDALLLVSGIQVLAVHDFIDCISNLNPGIAVATVTRTTKAATDIEKKLYAGEVGVDNKDKLRRRYSSGTKISSHALHAP